MGNMPFPVYQLAEGNNRNRPRTAGWAQKAPGWAPEPPNGPRTCWMSPRTPWMSPKGSNDTGSADSLIDIFNISPYRLEGITWELSYWIKAMIFVIILEPLPSSYDRKYHRGLQIMIMLTAPKLTFWVCVQLIIARTLGTENGCSFMLVTKLEY